jgi:hypothetical protein
VQFYWHDIHSFSKVSKKLPDGHEHFFGVPSIKTRPPIQVRQSPVKSSHEVQSELQALHYPSSFKYWLSVHSQVFSVSFTVKVESQALQIPVLNEQAAHFSGHSTQLLIPSLN